MSRDGKFGPEPDASRAVPQLNGPPGVRMLLGLQRDAGNASVAALVDEERSPVHDVIASSGRPVDPLVRADMESRFGADFSDVRIHTGDAARESAATLGAQAYTVGSDIVFQDYDPGSAPSRHTLAHELTHVLQQREGPVDGTDVGGGIRMSHPSDRYEREAATTADQIMSAPAPVQREDTDLDDLTDE